MRSTTGSGRRRSPTAEQLQAWRTYIETAETVRTKIGSRLQAESGVSAGDYAVLLALSEAPDRRMRSSALAQHIDWERSRLSHHLGRMERRSLVRREECVTDNRGAEVVLSSTGFELFRRASAPHLRAIQELFIGALMPEQLMALEAASRALAEHLAEFGAEEGKAE
jgi:DNA-binding MarR family transcriptional regulator